MATHTVAEGVTRMEAQELQDPATKYPAPPYKKLSVLDSTVGMVGDLQAIAGKAMPEIPSLDVPMLEDATAPQRKVG